MFSYGTDLSAESTKVFSRRQAFKYAEALLQQAEAELDEKREWYRFVQNHTRDAAEFQEMCQSETSQSYRRVLGVVAEERSLVRSTTDETTEANGAAAMSLSIPNPIADADSQPAPGDDLA